MHYNLYKTPDSVKNRSNKMTDKPHIARVEFAGSFLDGRCTDRPPTEAVGAFPPASSTVCLSLASPLEPQITPPVPRLWSAKFACSRLARSSILCSSSPRRCPLTSPRSAIAHARAIVASVIASTLATRVRTARPPPPRRPGITATAGGVDRGRAAAAGPGAGAGSDNDVTGSARRRSWSVIASASESVIATVARRCRSVSAPHRPWRSA